MFLTEVHSAILIGEIAHGPTTNLIKKVLVIPLPELLLPLTAIFFIVNGLFPFYPGKFFHLFQRFGIEGYLLVGYGMLEFYVTGQQ